MIIVYHNGATIVEMDNANTSNENKVKGKSIATGLLEVANDHPDELLVWCHQSLKEQLNIMEIEQLFHHKKILFSYNSYNGPYLDQNIGYIDASLFARINAAVTFATWQISSGVGGVHSEVLLALNNQIPLDKNFDYFLCSLAKLSMPKGLLCYSEPKLLKKKTESTQKKTSSFILFRFVKQHYRTRWVFLLMLNLLVYERKFPFLPFVFSFFYKNRSNLNIDLDSIMVQSSKKVVDSATVDVIIPTIGRKEYLYDVLKDLKAQTHLPTNIIIVEQNPDEYSVSELDYLTASTWPFPIKHIFTHQAGACNARNIALSQISSEWVFFADDDVRIENDFIQKALKEVNRYGVKAVTLKCYQKGESQSDTNVFQWGTFGSGCSLVFAKSIKHCKFGIGYEFGFGEDGDFGMQLRNQGYDILYLPEPEIIHLKAPVGGFRTKLVLRWHNESIQPKPSPTIMLYQILHNTREQILGYKTILFFKYFKHQTIKNPLTYYSNFQIQWKRSEFWANKLNEKS